MWVGALAWYFQTENMWITHLLSIYSLDTFASRLTWVSLLSIQTWCTVISLSSL